MILNKKINSAYLRWAKTGRKECSLCEKQGGIFEFGWIDRIPFLIGFNLLNKLNIILLDSFDFCTLFLYCNISKGFRLNFHS